MENTQLDELTNYELSFVEGGVYVYVPKMLLLALRYIGNEIL